MLDETLPNYAGFSWKTKTTSEPLAVLICDELENQQFIHGFSSRQGGVSPLPEKDLNLSLSVDNSPLTLENRRRFLSVLNAPYPIHTLKQTHSSVVWNVDSWKEGYEEEKIEGDALWTTQKTVFVGVKSADCLPILIGDKKTKACLAIHYQKDILEKKDRVFLNLRSANHDQLLSAGIPAPQIFICGECTIHHPQRYFSHRREGMQKKYPVGRQLSLIGRSL
jgi:copper oxidase (laccase) domain-containing protein